MSISKLFISLTFKKNTVISDMSNMLIKFVIVILMDISSLTDSEDKNFPLFLLIN